MANSFFCGGLSDFYVNFVTAKVSITKQREIMNFSEKCFRIFEQATRAYHVTDSVDAPARNPYPVNSVEFYLYMKNWIDGVQWHLESLIRRKEVSSEEIARLWRRIKKLNTDREDMVELIDSIIAEMYRPAKGREDAPLNTETPGWALDRLSTLCLRIYHIRRALLKAEDQTQQQNLLKMEAQLVAQKDDLSTALDQLLADVRTGKKRLKLYKQIKIYDAIPYE